MDKNINGCLFRRAGPLAVLAAFWLLPGCSEDRTGGEAQKAAQAERRQMLEDLQRLQRQREQDGRVYEARKAEAESDTSAAITLWIASSAALLVVIILLVRERHIRRALQELLGLLTGRKERGP